MITVRDNWKVAFEGSSRAEIEKLLPDFLTASRWFGGKAKTIRSAKLADVLQQEHGDGTMVLALIDVSYLEGGADRYTLPMTAAFDAEADRVKHDYPEAIIGALTVLQNGTALAGILYDALWHPDCAYSLLDSMG
ncbi:MAG TPA: hypothetical protein PKL59_13505, partial [Nitrospira sp.]|nr:hypothetical protein [Nitrospira sp.]